jgi:Holliday junction resolvase RusA-like endonuclease
MHTVIMRESVKHSKEWRALIKRHAILAWRGKDPIATAVEAHVTFYFERQYGISGEVYPSHETDFPTVGSGAGALGDKDKLFRNLGDALEDARVIENDRLIVRTKEEKCWGKPAGMLVTLLTPDPMVPVCLCEPCVTGQHLRQGC